MKKTRKLNMTFEEFINKFNLNLNDQQKAAVLKTGGQTLLLAVPGSGKTTVIVNRIAYMIYCLNIAPPQILTMTYSVAAAKDMKERFAQKFGEEMASNLDFRTINSFCYLVLKKYERFNNTKMFSLIKDSQTSGILKEIYINIHNEYPSEGTIKDIKTKITYCNNMMLKDEDMEDFNEEYNFLQIYKNYQNYKKDNKLMDYDDQMKYAKIILENYPQILSYYQKKYLYVSIDEAQDTSKIQHEIIRLLVSKNKNIFMVGDEDQSIYGFRAAYPQALLEFDKFYPSANVLFIEKNYRCSKNIVTAANRLIKHNDDRRNKNMITQNDEGLEIKHTSLNNRYNEYEYLRKLSENCRKETAILYRYNESVIPIIDMLNKNNINYSIKENDALFFTNFIVVDIMNILKFSQNMTDLKLFNDICYKLNCYISKIQMEQINRLIGNQNSENILDIFISSVDCSLSQKKKIKELKINLGLVAKCNSFDAIIKILYEVDYNKYLIDKNNNNNNAFNQKINTVLAIAYQYKNIEDFIQRFGELKNIISQGNKNKESNLVLSTIHSSKGLEYQKVIIIDVCDGFFPSVINPKNRQDKEVLEEERRLFYVAVTRAKSELEIITYKNDCGNKVELSFFIKELLDLIPKTVNYANKIKPARNINIKHNKIKIDNSELIKYKVGTRIKHKMEGEGIIIDINDKLFSIKFKDEVKIYDIGVCLNNGLIVTA
ncbi:MAG: ATP-dependent helicase [Clostridia bacterium]|nr:ATP-dependent helicase [Clostridia bacterium]